MGRPGKYYDLSTVLKMQVTSISVPATVTNNRILKLWMWQHWVLITLTFTHKDGKGLHALLKAQSALLHVERKRKKKKAKAWIRTEL